MDLCERLYVCMVVQHVKVVANKNGFSNGCGDSGRTAAVAVAAAAGTACSWPLRLQWRWSLQLVGMAAEM